MSKFKVGDKVRCTDDTHSGRLKKGEVYTVARHGYDDTYDLIYVEGLGIAWLESRFELVEDVEARHIHHDLIVAWAKGAKIEVYNESAKVWVPSTCPAWSNICKYRLKPEPKPDVVSEVRIHKWAADRGGFFGWTNENPNVRYTFDGETGELKSVELINQLNEEQV